jgi:hypothetical protein
MDGNKPWPSSLKVNSRFSLSFSFFPRRLFFPPYIHEKHRVSHIVSALREGGHPLKYLGGA